MIENCYWKNSEAKNEAIFKKQKMKNKIVKMKIDLGTYGLIMLRTKQVQKNYDR